MSTIVCVADENEVVLGADSRVMSTDFADVVSDSLEKITEVGPDVFLATSGFVFVSEVQTDLARKLVSSLGTLDIHVLADKLDQASRPCYLELLESLATMEHPRISLYTSGKEPFYAFMLVGRSSGRLGYVYWQSLFVNGGITVLRRERFSGPREVSISHGASVRHLVGHPRLWSAPPVEVVRWILAEQRHATPEIGGEDQIVSISEAEGTRWVSRLPNPRTCGEMAHATILSGLTLTPTGLKSGSNTPENWAQNPGFEDDTAHWTFNVEASISTSSPYTGTKCVKITGPSQGINQTIYGGVRPGDVLAAEAWVKSGVGADCTMYLLIRWIDAAGATISDTTWSSLAPPASAWTKMVNSGVAPANTSGCIVWVLPYYGTTGDWFVDNVCLRRAVNGDLIEPLAVDTAHLAALAVSEAKIAAAAVTLNKIGAAAVDATKIADLAVGTAHIQAAAITAAKIGALAVGTAAIDDLAVTTAKIALLAITDALIANATISSAKIADLVATKITAGTFVSGVVYAGNIACSQLQAGTISVAIGLTAPDINISGSPAIRIKSGIVTIQGPIHKSDLSAGYLEVSSTGTSAFVYSTGVHIAGSTYTADLTDLAVSVKSGDGELGGHYLKLGGQTVLGLRGAAVADPTGGSVVDVECRAQLAALLARLRYATGHGLIS